MHFARLTNGSDTATPADRFFFDNMAELSAPLVEAGVDVLHCSQRRFWEPEFPEINGGEGLNFAGWAKKLTGAQTITVGSVGLSGTFFGVFGGEASQPADLGALIRRLEREEFDLAAVGRALLADAGWVANCNRAAAPNGRASRQRPSHRSNRAIKTGGQLAPGRPVHRQARRSHLVARVGRSPLAVARSGQHCQRLREGRRGIVEACACSR